MATTIPNDTENPRNLLNESIMRDRMRDMSDTSTMRMESTMNHASGRK